MEATNKIQKQKNRRLRYLCSTHPMGKSDNFSIKAMLDTFSGLETNQKKYPGKYYNHLKETLELLNLFVELGFNDKEASEYWYKTYFEQWRVKRSYYGTPIKVKKDNPNTYGEEFFGGGTKRQPRKCRKTAWKRFNKLFPNHIIK